MARPALSATRSIDIIEFLASFPERGFTMSEIVRATGINVASCHAILNALIDRGYLIRIPDQKAYALGSGLIASGQAAFRSQPMVDRARRAAEELCETLSVAVMLCTLIGPEILAVLSFDAPSGAFAGMRVGERVPLVAPIGVPFVAWAPEEEVEAWIARRAGVADAALVAEWRRDLEVTRERGFQLTMRASVGPTLASTMANMATNRREMEYKGELERYINSVNHNYQPESIADDAVYDVQLIACPLFDNKGAAAFNLCLGGFPSGLSGAEVNSYAQRLMRACVDVMRADRPQMRWR